jgi:hypothetical protein
VGGIVTELKTSIVAPALLLLIAIAFSPVLFHGWVYDDPAIFSSELYSFPITRPLAVATFLFDAAVNRPWVSHLLNLMLHGCAVLLVRQLFGLTPALLFAVHPVVTEPVNYVWARPAILMTIFCLLSLRDWRSGRQWRAVLWFAIALLAKEECAAFPLVLAGIERRWKPLAAMFALSACAGLAVMWAASVTAGSQAGPQAAYTPVQYLSGQGAAILRYLSLLVWPVGRLSIEPAVPLGAWWAWGVVLLIAAAAWRLRWHWVLAGLVLLLPSSSVFPANDLAAERRMYLPAVAFFAGAPEFRWAPVLAAVLAVLSFGRSQAWHSEQSLWADVLLRSPGSVRARIHMGGVDLLTEAKEIAPTDPRVATELGRAYLEAGRADLALAEFGRALALEPRNPRAISNRGVALQALGQKEAARADFERALRVDPCSFEALHNLGRPVPEGCRMMPWQRRWEGNSP